MLAAMKSGRPIAASDVGPQAGTSAGPSVSLRIGLNVLYLIPGEVGGTEVYARELIRAVARIVDYPVELVAFVNREARDWPLPARVKRVVCPVSARARWLRYLYEQFILPSQARREGVRLLHSLGYVAPVFMPIPSIVTVHDLVFTYQGMTPLRRAVLKIFVTASMRTADCVLTDSIASKRQIVSYLRSDARDVLVVHLGGEHRLHTLSAEQRLVDRRPYFLAFSSYSRSKNIGFLLRAFRAASSHRDFDHALVLVGYLRPEDAREAATIPRVQTTGRISDSDVSGWLAGADYLVVPSTYEGFGLPVAEALWMGVPSLVADRGSLPEVGGEAALVFDPDREEQLSRLLLTVATDRSLRRELARRAVARAPQFSWDAAARQTVDVYTKWASAFNTDST